MIAEKIKPQTREMLFIDLYKSTFPKVAAFVKQRGGNFNEAKDVFQDALVIYYEKQIQAGFFPEVNENVYLMGICKNLWYKKYKDENLKQSFELTNEFKLTYEPEIKISENLMRFVTLSGKKCLELLKAFYFDNLNMKEIAMGFGFSGERSATAQKYKCIEKVRDAIKKRALNKEDFYE